MTTFEGYWDALERELAQVDAAVETEVIPRMSSPVATVSWARFTSIGPYRIGGFLSVPNRPGPHPALLATPRHGSVNQPPHPFDQERSVVLVVMHRGQRLADVPFKAAYPGLLTHGIADSSEFVFRGIAADVLRAFDVLAAQPGVDRDRIAATGGDLALIAAARRTIAHVAVTEPLLFHRVEDAMAGTTAYPIEEYADHLRAHPGERDALLRTTALFDPIAHAPGIRGQVLIPTADEPGMGGRAWFDGLFDALGDRAETVPVTHRGGRDNDAVDAWLSAALGAPARPRSWTVAS